MLVQRLNGKTTILLLIIFIVAALRLLTHFAEHSNSFLSLTPLGAMALFGGAYFRGNIKPFLFTLLPLFLSDVILCFTVYSNYREGLLYPQWYWVYGSFALMTLWGKLILNEVRIVNLIIAILIATLTHWLLSNIGDCLNAKNTAGFFELYGSRLLSAISFESKILLGTVVYSICMFGSFELAQRKFKGLQFSHTTS